MTYTPTIYDWRASLVPLNQTFRAGGQAIDGGLTSGGINVLNPEPGGRAEMVQDFAAFTSEQQNRDASWTMARILNGAIMRVPVWWYSVQLVPPEDVGGSVGDDNSLTWSDGTTWAGGVYWSFNPTAPVYAPASQGTETVQIDMSAYGEVLQIGHVIGFKVDTYDFAHTVMDISYDASDVATVTVSPPLRRDLTTSSEVRFRPFVMAVCSNARSVMGLYQRGRHVQLNAAQWVEALV